ncbi:hypothetical protein VTK73DRAFT_56 [Phialemonium thermophilum]|uniref:Uncharacterized protein n=1 Tax=Phialemonium thermophilum TaxID=223376 RepID=A0ABR3Y930_9PEZI
MAARPLAEPRSFVMDLDCLNSSGPPEESVKSTFAVAQTDRHSKLERFPPLMSLAPSIFVPLVEDITKPVDIPRDRIKRLEWMINAMDHHRDGVRENMTYLFIGERDRISIEAAEEEARAGATDTMPGLPPDEVDWIIGNMEAPIQPEYDYSVLPQPMNEPKTCNDRPSLREDTVNRLVDLVAYAQGEMVNYDTFMQNMRDYYLKKFEREKQRMDGMGKGPER